MIEQLIEYHAAQAARSANTERPWQNSPRLGLSKADRARREAEALRKHLERLAF